MADDNNFVDPCEADDLGLEGDVSLTRQGLIKSFLLKKLQDSSIDPKGIITSIDREVDQSNNEGQPPPIDDAPVAGSVDAPASHLPKLTVPSANEPAFNPDEISNLGLTGWFSSFGKRNWFFHNPRKGLPDGNCASPLMSRSQLATSLDASFGTDVIGNVRVGTDRRGVMDAEDYASTQRYSYNHNHYIYERAYRYGNRQPIAGTGNSHGLGNPLHAPGYFRDAKVDSFRYASGKHHSYFPGGETSDSALGLRLRKAYVRDKLGYQWDNNAIFEHRPPHDFEIPAGIAWVNPTNQFVPSVRITQNGRRKLGQLSAHAGVVIEHGLQADHVQSGHVATRFVQDRGPFGHHEFLEWRYERTLLQNSDWNQGFASAARKELMVLKCYPNENRSSETPIEEDLKLPTLYPYLLSAVPDTITDNTLDTGGFTFQLPGGLLHAEASSIQFSGENRTYSMSPNPMLPATNAHYLTNYARFNGSPEAMERARIARQPGSGILDAHPPQTNFDLDRHSNMQDLHLRSMTGLLLVDALHAYNRSGWSWRNYFYGLYPTVSKRWYHIHSLRKYLTNKASSLSGMNGASTSADRHPSDIAMRRAYRQADKGRDQPYMRRLDTRGNLPPLLLDWDGNELGDLSADTAGGFTQVDTTSACVEHYTNFKHGEREKFSENMFPIIPFYGPEYYPDELSGKGSSVESDPDLLGDCLPRRLLLERFPFFEDTPIARIYGRGLGSHWHFWQMAYDISQTDLEAETFWEILGASELAFAFEQMGARIGDKGHAPNLEAEIDPGPFRDSGYCYGAGPEIIEGNVFDDEEKILYTKYLRELNPFTATRLRPPTVGKNAIFTDITTSIESFVGKSDLDMVDYRINSYFDAKGEYVYYDEQYEETISPTLDHKKLTNLYQFHPASWDVVQGSLSYKTRSGFNDQDSVGWQEYGDGADLNVASKYNLPPEDTPETEIYASSEISSKAFKDKYKIRKTTPMYIDIEFKQKASSVFSDLLSISGDGSYSEVMFGALGNMASADSGPKDYAIVLDTVMYNDMSNKLKNIREYGSTEEQYAEYMDHVRERYRVDTILEDDDAYLLGSRDLTGETKSVTYSGGQAYLNKNNLFGVPGYALKGFERDTWRANRTSTLPLHVWLSAVEESVVSTSISAEERLSKIFGYTVFSGKLNEFVSKHFRSYEDILDGTPAHSEILGYKVKKYRKTKNGPDEYIQTKCFASTPREGIIKYFDSQVKYGEMYRLEIYSVTMIVGNQYAYLDAMTPKAVEDFNRLGRVRTDKLESRSRSRTLRNYLANLGDDENPDAAAMQYKYISEFMLSIEANTSGTTERKEVSSDIYDWGDNAGVLWEADDLTSIDADRMFDNTDDPANLYVGIYNKPHVVITEIFDRSINVAITDKPPVPPDVEVVSYKGVKTIVNFNLNSMTGEMFAKPVILDEDDEEQYKITAMNQGVPVLHIQNEAGEYDSKLNENALLHYKNDDLVKIFEVFRLDREPSSWADFKNRKASRISNGTTAANYVDKIKVNKKYWYTFRSQDVHGHVSIPSIIYQIEMVSDGEIHYLKQDLFQFKERKKKTKKDVRRLMKIMPSNLQKSFDIAAAASEEWNHALWASDKRLGLSEHPMWGKKFLVKIKSKDSGKQVDLRLKFNRKHGNVDKDGKVIIENI